MKKTTVGNIKEIIATKHNVNVNTDTKATVLKPSRDNVPRKNTNSKTLKVPSTRYGAQNELKEHNQQLKSDNEELQRCVVEMESKVAVLEQQCEDLRRENSETQKRLRDCHAYLVAAHIDPVLGRRIDEPSDCDTENQRREVMTISKKLLNELETFDSMASDHRGQLQEIQNVMTELKEACGKQREERATINLEMEELERDLEEAEQILLE